MKKSNKLTKNDRQSIAIVGLLVAVFLSLLWGGMNSKRVKVLEHYVNCESICAPRKVDVDRSNIYCNCLEEDENGAN